MARHAAKELTTGFFLLLVAAFVLLAGFVMLIIAVGTPTPTRVIAAVVLLIGAVLLLRAGYAALHRASQKGPSGDPGTEASGNEDDGGTPHRRHADEPMGP